MLSRRKFLGIAGGVGVSGAAGAGAWAALVRDAAEQAIDERAQPQSGPNDQSAPSTTLPPKKRALVVLQLAGGNDGLNTVIPASGRYRDARPTIAVAEADAVALGATGYSLAPQLAPLAAHFDAGRLAVLDGIGIADQSRSHFKAQDVWWAASPDPGTTGWLGRWLDSTAPSAPNPLRAIALGGGSPALAAERSLSTVVLQPAQFSFRATAGCDAKTLTTALLATAQPLAGDGVFAAAQQALPEAVEAIDLLQKVRSQAASEPGAGTATSTTTTTAPGAAAPRAYGPNSATGLLQAAAGIVELDIGTQVVLVNVGGFDTHADQPSRHADLLEDVSNAIEKFWLRIDKAGLSDRVLLITTSEFGRRVAQNASNGTDHGLAGVQFALGSGVTGGRLIGEANLAALVDGDVPLALDTRSLYASALDWLGGPTDELLGGRYDRYGLLR